ncbi:MAG: efflux RND transporter periplasmic adaptor subunit [Gammaproteobacteria bacterium]|nr:efflux RND transporter periplasmic adaptor subunit [Gammaproteobacteria bacterium]
MTTENLAADPPEAVSPDDELIDEPSDEFEEFDELDALEETAKPSFFRRSKKTLIQIGLSIVFVSIAFVFVFIVLSREPPTPPRLDIEPPSLLVQVLEMQPEPVRFKVVSQGVVTPRTRTTIVSEVTGQIVEVSPALESGGFFTKNDVLAQIDPRNYETALKRAQADLAKAKTKVQTESALASQALADWEKLKRLAPNTESPSELTLRKPQLREVLAEQDLSEAALQKATEDLERTVIRAPFDGMIVEKHADLGQFVNTGTQIATSVSIELAEVRLPLSLRDFHYLDLEHLARDRTVPVTLTADTGRDELASWTGEIVRSEGIINQTSRVVYVVAQIKNPYKVSSSQDQPLLIGTFVNAEITGREAGELFVVPRNAIYDGNTVWIVNNANEIYPQELKIIRSDRNVAYISEGLANGDKICITPMDQPIPGMRVKYSE